MLLEVQHHKITQYVTQQYMVYVSIALWYNSTSILLILRFWTVHCYVQML
jgi:hypothetical protein